MERAARELCWSLVRDGPDHDRLKGAPPIFQKGGIVLEYDNESDNENVDAFGNDN